MLKSFIDMLVMFKVKFSVSDSDTSKWKQKNTIEKLIQQRNEMLLAGDSLYASHIQRLNQQISFLMR